MKLGLSGSLQCRLGRFSFSPDSRQLALALLGLVLGRAIPGGKPNALSPLLVGGRNVRYHSEKATTLPSGSPLIRVAGTGACLGTMNRQQLNSRQVPLLAE